MKCIEAGGPPPSVLIDTSKRHEEAKLLVASNAIESAKTIALDAGKDYLGNRDVVSRSHHDVICLTRNRRWGR